MSSQNVPDQMKAARVVGESIPLRERATKTKANLLALFSEFKKPMSIETIPVPKDLKEEECLLKIEAAGWCHTDLQVLEGVYEGAGSKPPLVGSHEPVGRIVAFGKNGDRNGELKIGDRVGSINTFAPCLKCEACKKGPQLCENMPGMLGLTLDGGFAEYMRASSRVVQKCPEDIPPEELAPLFCAGATVVRLYFSFC